MSTMRVAKARSGEVKSKTEDLKSKTGDLKGKVEGLVALVNVYKEQIESLKSEKELKELKDKVKDLEKEKEGVVTVPLKTFNRYKERLDKLSALEDAGVDNWSGYGDAMDCLDENT